MNFGAPGDQVPKWELVANKCDEIIDLRVSELCSDWMGVRSHIGKNKGNTNSNTQGLATAHHSKKRNDAAVEMTR